MLALNGICPCNHLSFLKCKQRKAYHSLNGYKWGGRNYYALYNVKSIQQKEDMNCPQCKAPIADTVKSCPYCNFKFQTEQGTYRKTTVLGKLSLLFACITIGCIFVFFLLMSSRLNWANLIFFSLLTLLSIVFSLVAIILGAIAYFGKTKDRYGLFGFVLGICFLISSFVLIPAATYIYVSGLQPTLPKTYMMSPTVVFSQNIAQDALTVEFVSDEVYWYELYVIGTYETKPGMKLVEEGDQITGCSGTLTIRYTPSDAVVGSWTFN